MAEGRLNPREKARLEEKKKNRKTRVKYTVIGVIVLLVIALVVFVNSRAFLDGLAALRVNGTKYTVADVNYEYQSEYMQFTQSYGDYLSIFLDTSVPLDEQDCILDPEGGTWHDYFKNNAESRLTELTAFYDAAVSNGYSLTEDELTRIESAISSYTFYANVYGYTTDGYLAANFGPGNNEKTVRRHMEKELLVDRYLNDLYENSVFTDAEKDEYYAAHADSLNKVHYLYYYVSTADDENAAQTVQDVVDAMEGTDEQAFRDAVLAVTGSEATKTSYNQSTFLNQFDGSVTEEELKSGTVFTHTSDASSYAVFILSLDDNDYNTVSVRHILIKAEDADGDGEYSEEEKQQAYDALVAIRDEWLAAGGTEESFAELAIQHSQDGGSAEAGGRYDDIFKGQMVEEFDAFCFDEHRPGDYDIVYGESASYAGYHLIYYIGAEGELYSRQLAEDELRNEAYNQTMDEILSGYAAERTFMWRYVMSGQ